MTHPIVPEQLTELMRNAGWRDDHATRRLLRQVTDFQKTEDNIAQLENDIAEATRDAERLAGTSWETMWRGDLSVFVASASPGYM